MTYKCKNCTHNSVCKHQDSYKKTLDSMNTKIPTPFSISLECPFYYSVQGPTLWGSSPYVNSATRSAHATTLEGVNGTTTDCICGTVALDDAISDLSTSVKATCKSK